MPKHVSGPQDSLRPKLAAIRHHLSKQPLLDRLLTYVQHQGLTRDDVFVASYPRSGSTWLRFMLYELVTGQESSFERVDSTVAGMGYQRRAASILTDGGRLLKTHEPYRKEYNKAIYLVRDVRDVVVSEYRYLRSLRYYTGEFDGFFELFMSGKANRYGFWADQVRSWLDAAERGNIVHLIRFEDLKRDPYTALAHMAEFLECPRSQEEIETVVAHHSIEAMRRKEDAARKFRDNADNIRFVGQGATGKGSSQLSAAQLELLQNATQGILNRLGYEF